MGQTALGATITMGILKGDRARIAAQLTAILRKPEYTYLLQKEMENNRYRAEAQSRRDDLKRKQNIYQSITGDSLPKNKFDTGPTNPAEFAERAVNDAFGERDQPKLLDPINALELKPTGESLRLYRSYDGNVAGTLGRWWCQPALLQDIVAAVGDLKKAGAKEQVLDFMKSAMFVHPGWNLGTEIAVLTLPEGVSLPVIAGLGNWRAMKAGSKGHPPIHNADDLMKKYKLMPIPGPEQIFIPFVPGMRVDKIVKQSPAWPFANS